MSRRSNRYHQSSYRRAFVPLWLKILLAVIALIVCCMLRGVLPVPQIVEDAPRRIASRVAPGIFPPSPEQAASEADFRCRVVRVTDGDSLRCQDGTRIRLHAVAARETDGTCTQGHPCPSASAEAATATLRRLAHNQWLDCMTTGQSYNRVTAICWTPQKVEINCAMVESGTALLWDRFDRQTSICRHKRRSLGQTFDF